MLGSLGQLGRGPLDEHRRHYLTRAEWATEQAGRLAQEVLSSGNVEPTDTKIIDLNEAIAAFAEALGQLPDRAGGGQTDFSIELAPGRLPVACNRIRLEAVLLNLLRNGADATAGGGSVTIRTSGHSRGKLGDPRVVTLAVSDTGIGMPSEVAQHATDAFFSTKGPTRGAGLGLWMVERFAADHGGKVEIETAPGRGRHRIHQLAPVSTDVASCISSEMHRALRHRRELGIRPRQSDQTFRESACRPHASSPV